jgi:glycosyltransferase involved in cell wall biosynthesis
MKNSSPTIAFFIPDLEGGGAERAFVELTNQFVDLGVRVDLVLVRAKGPYLSEVRPEVRLVDLQGSRTTLAVLKLFRYLRENRPDAIISGLDTANMTSMVACIAAGCSKRAILTQRSIPSECYGLHYPRLQRLWLTILRLIYARARLIISNSHAASHDLCEGVGIPPANLAVIHNSIDMVRIERLAIEDPKHPWTTSSAKPLLLSVGSLGPLKDFSTLLRAFAIVRQSLDCNLAVLGEGTERNRLEALAQEIGVGDWVQLLGFDANPFRWMSKASLLISSSITESCPNVIQQALACGTPVVATDCPGGTSEILERGKWGRLVPVANPQAMAEAIIATLQDKSHPNGRLRAADFDPSKNAKQYLKLILPDFIPYPTPTVVL